MKKQLFSLGATLAMVAGLALSGTAVSAAGQPDFSDNFDRADLGSNYAVAGAASITDGKLVFDSVGAAGVGGVKIITEKFQDYTLQFDVNLTAGAAQMFLVSTGLQANTAPTAEELNPSFIKFDVNDVYVTNAAPYNRLWASATPNNTDMTLKMEVIAGDVKLYKKGAAEADSAFVQLATTFPSPIRVSEDSGYISLMYEGQVKAVVDNLTVTAINSASVTARDRSGVTVDDGASTISLPNYPQGVTMNDLVKDLIVEGATSTAVTKADGTAVAATDKIESGMKLLLKLGEVTKRTYTIQLTDMPANPTVDFTDDFERAEIGDNYLVNVTEGEIAIKDGKLVFNKPQDINGVYVKTPTALRNYTLSFDFKPEEGSAYLALVVGLKEPVKGNYITPYTTRISIGTEMYNVSDYHSGVNQLNYTPGSGLDTDPTNAGGNAWWRTGNLGVELGDDEYMNMRLVFEDGTLRMYYKRNTDPDYMLYVEHSAWKGVQSNGYIGFLAQGSKNCQFSIDNLSIVSEIPAKLDLNEKSGEFSFNDKAATLDSATGKVNIAYAENLRTVAQLKAAVTCTDKLVSAVVLDKDGNIVADDAALISGMFLGLAKNDVAFSRFEMVVEEKSVKPTDPTDPTNPTKPSSPDDDKTPSTGAAMPLAVLFVATVSAAGVMIGKKRG